MKLLWLLVTVWIVTEVEAVNTGPFLPAYDELLKPEQIHTSVGKEPSTVFITWVTQNDAGPLMVQYGTDRNLLTLAVNASKSTFKDGGKLQRAIWIYRAKLDQLQASTWYFTAPENSDGRVFKAVKDYVSGLSSKLLQFKTLPSSDTKDTIRIAVVGDMGVKNARALPEMKDKAVNDQFNLVLHVGDFAYDMDVDEGRVGDQFMRSIEPIASRSEIMKTHSRNDLCNFDSFSNFSHYTNRFTTEGGSLDSHFYSFNVGKMHIISFSSEFYYYVWYGWEQMVQQYYWLKADLEEANRPENRAKRPWIIAMGHRPMYCSNSNDPQHCTNKDNAIREGVVYRPYNKEPAAKLFSLEELFYQHGVDLIFSAHEHSYERMWPVYRSKLKLEILKPKDLKA
ncbi:hypothetical protein Ciccas_009211 [Cichlidogyrus casuarinus]|uniref:Purple acid phosphatase n=1 Tax=Cichlidogyrus casuarinus TaxID=1844966 RepID=A0ABD2Q255_9PLAT